MSRCGYSNCNSCCCNRCGNRCYQDYNRQRFCCSVPCCQNNFRGGYGNRGFNNNPVWLLLLLGGFFFF